MGKQTRFKKEAIYSLRLKEWESVQQHIKKMTAIFDELSVINDPITEEDRVVHLLASLRQILLACLLQHLKQILNLYQIWRLLLNAYCM